MNGLNPFGGFNKVLLEVLLAVVPFFVVFLFCQCLYIKLAKEELRKLLTGLLLVALGMAFFLQGINIGFLPYGQAMGEALAGGDSLWILLPIGFVLGFVAMYAEPAVQVLGFQVEKASTGAIKKRLMLYSISLGVGVIMVLGMVRLIWGIPLIYILLPGYLLAVILMRFSRPSFIAMAFDAGGVATGPMIVTFVMAVMLGIAENIKGRDPVLDGFGLIALVALAPILSVLMLGILFFRKGGER